MIFNNIKIHLQKRGVNKLASLFFKIELNNALNLRFNTTNIILIIICCYCFNWKHWSYDAPIYFSIWFEQWIFLKTHHHKQLFHIYIVTINNMNHLMLQSILEVIIVIFLICKPPGKQTDKSLNDSNTKIFLIIS